MAVFVRALASAPVWRDDGDEPYRYVELCGYGMVVGGKTFRDCGMVGGRLRRGVDILLAVGGIANGGVVASAKGGEYDKGTIAVCCGVGALVAGLKADTGLETTLVRELG